MTLSRRRLLQAALVLPPALAARAEPPRTSGPQVFADFGNGWGDWTTEGDAFSLSPADDTLFPGAITGFGGRGFVCTLHPRRGVAATGRAISPAFVIAKPFISFKIGGGNFPHGGAATVGEATLNLVVAGQVVRTATGDGTPHLSPATWDVADLAGKQAHFEIVDSTRSDRRGYVLVDDIVFDDRRTTDFQKWLDATAAAFVERNHYPGVWLSVYHKGEEIGATACGYSDFAHRTPASLSDVIWMASVSKPVVATLFARAVEMGLVSYNSTLGEIPGTDNLPAAFRRITAEELIGHTSGLPRDMAYQTVPIGTDAQQTRKSALLLFGAREVASPGHYSYSNIGYTALTVLMETKTGRSLDQWVADTLVREQGLSSFSCGAKAAAPTAYLLTTEGYIPVSGPSVGAYDWAAAGSIRATVPDLCRFGLLHCGHQYNHKPLFTRESSLFASHRLCSNSTHTHAGYWIEQHGDGGYLLFHTGVLNGSRGDITIMFVEPLAGLVIVAYTNCWMPPNLAVPRGNMNQELVLPIYRQLKGWPPLPPETPPAASGHA